MTKPDLYEDLGVSRDALPGDIRKAFRKKAKKAHPDAGGSEQDFHAIEPMMGLGPSFITVFGP